ncbi:MAG: 50S ribosomal protein L22 [Elusimicrobia bacterium]|jgi:large subunit ribosomal protein L22|nr:50S ribosomal protein L22 [Elusimicrobiota bacterium]
MEVVAKAKYVRHSSRKVREITGLLVGKEVNESMSVVRNIPKRASRTLEKVIKSAKSNAERKSSGSGWKIKNIIVEDGPASKRFRAATMGRAVTIKKRTSHITVVLEEIQRRNK